MLFFKQLFSIHFRMKPPVPRAKSVSKLYPHISNGMDMSGVIQGHYLCLALKILVIEPNRVMLA